MHLNVIRVDDGHRLRGGEGVAAAGDVELVNEFLAHLGARRFSRRLFAPTPTTC
jgi:hypothetical protein